METIIILINHFFDVLWWPLSRTPAYVDIIIISAISAWVFLVIFKKTSNQEMIGLYKRRIFAHILEIRLYKDQPILTIRIVINILKNNLIYLRYTLMPLFIIILPVLIISIQLNNRYGYLPLKIHDSFIIRADIDKQHLSEPSDILNKVQCDLSGGIIIETQPMRIVSEGSVFWRAKAVGYREKLRYCVIAVAGSPKTVKKNIVTSKILNRRFSPARTKWSLQNIFMHNAEDFIPEQSIIDSISVSYKRATYPLFGLDTDPIVLYFILTLVLGFALKPLLHVDF